MNFVGKCKSAILFKNVFQIPLKIEIPSLLNGNLIIALLNHTYLIVPYCRWIMVDPIMKKMVGVKSGDLGGKAISQHFDIMLSGKNCRVVYTYVCTLTPSIQV